MTWVQAFHDVAIAAIIGLVVIVVAVVWLDSL